MKIHELKPGQKARIVCILQEDAAYCQQLMVMGLLPGVTLQLLHRAPLGDPIAIQVQNTILTLRKEEAMVFEVAIC